MFLSQIPYTGFSGGPVETALFWGFLLLWSGVLSYFLTIKGLGKRIADRGAKIVRILFGEEREPRIAEEGDMPVRPMQHISAVIAERPVFTREAPADLKGAVSVSEATVPLFISFLVDGKSDKAFSTLKSLHMNGGETKDFFAKIVCELDKEYQCRMGEGTRAHEYVEQKLSHLSNGKLEELIDAFLQGIDRTYSKESTAIKLALVKALDVACHPNAPKLRPSEVRQTADEGGSHTSFSMPKTDEPAAALLSGTDAPKAAPRPMHKETPQGEKTDDFILSQIQRSIAISS